MEGENAIDPNRAGGRRRTRGNGCLRRTSREGGGLRAALRSPSGDLSRHHWPQELRGPVRRPRRALAALLLEPGRLGELERLASADPERVRAQSGATADEPAAGGHRGGNLELPAASDLLVRDGALRHAELPQP